jgi:ATP-dependent Clp protease ATP-binding subunit ClpB
MVPQPSSAGQHRHPLRRDREGHPDVLNVLLQILEDRRLTDGQGGVVEFKNAVVIMTSSVGSQFIAEAGGEEPPELTARSETPAEYTASRPAGSEGERIDYERMKELVTEALRQAFRPEFLNRVDETVIFHRLGRDSIRRIVDIQVGRLAQRLAERRMSLELTDAARDLLAESGWEPAYGTRPLKRAIQRMVFDPLARRILGGDFAEGDTVLVDYPRGAESLTFTKAPPATKEAPVGSPGPKESAGASGPKHAHRRKKNEVIDAEVVE